MKNESIRAAALSIKTYVETLIGAIAFFIIVMHVLEVPIGGEESLDIFKRKHPLKVAAFALVLAASLDLLFMLYSPSLKEGFDALLLGFIAAILMIISEDIVPGWEISLTIFVLTLCMLAICIVSAKYNEYTKKEEL
jgi:hypothetical protein